MRTTEGHFIVHYGPKGVPDSKLHSTHPIFSEESAMTRGVELKQEHGHAHISKINRKGKVIQTLTVALVAAHINAA